MDPSPPNNLVVAALLAGYVYLVDEYGTRLHGEPTALLASTDRVWAHLCDPLDGKWYVEPLQQAADLQHPRYAAMLTHD